MFVQMSYKYYVFADYIDLPSGVCFGTASYLININKFYILMMSILE